MTTRTLDPSELVDYADHHSGTMATQPGRLNPYKLGIELLRDIEERWNKGQFGPEWEECDNYETKMRGDRQLGRAAKKSSRSARSTPTSPSSETKRVNLFDGISIVAGAMIGSGIFIVSADIARNVGSPGWLMVVWLITGIITIIGALSYGELASMMPQVGGQYVYLREAYHPLIGFLFGWTTFLVIQCGSIAAVAVAFAKFSGVLFPWISERNILFHIGSLNINSTMLIAIVMISFLTWLNTRGIVTGKTVQNFFSSTKVIALFGFIAVGFLATKGIIPGR